jgi:hypothetical protein
VLRYIVGSVDYGLDYIRGDGVSLVGYTDSNWAGCATDRKSTSGCCFGLGLSCTKRGNVSKFPKPGRYEIGPKKMETSGEMSYIKKLKKKKNIYIYIYIYICMYVCMYVYIVFFK